MLALSSPRSRLAWLGVAYSLVAGCSPTYQSVYEGDVRFEHCYRVDEERQVPITDKVQCWRGWTRRYSHGQSRDRIGYAVARERTLAQAMAAGERAAPRGIMNPALRALPQPINAYTPPPQTMTPTASATADANANNGLHGSTAGAASGAGANGAGANGAGPHGGPATAEGSFLAAATSGTPLADAPGASCAGACGKTWVGCKQPCKGAACRSSCDEQYRACMKACY